MLRLVPHSVLHSTGHAQRAMPEAPFPWAGHSLVLVSKEGKGQQEGDEEGPHCQLVQAAAVWDEQGVRLGAVAVGGWGRWVGGRGL